MGMSSRLKEVGRVARDDLKNLMKGRRSTMAAQLSESERAALGDLRRDGFAAVESYWSAERAFAVRDRLERYLEAGRSTDYENGAYLRFWDNREYDEGVRRIYHAERLVPQLKEFREDPSILRIIEAYYGVPFYSGVLTYQHNTRSNENTRYFHVDSFSKEFKAFLYLDDVDPGNGPFTYLSGTHRSHLIRVMKHLMGNREGSSTSFYERDLKSKLSKEVQVCAPAGTLILADVRGLHRGSPQKDRSRSVLVNYLYPTAGDVFIDK